jgi:protein-disulfide isomerase
VTFTRLQPWLGTVARLALGAIWIWASLSKLHDPRRFVQAVRAYDATPEWLSKAIGYGLPVLEFCLGVLLVLGIVTRLAAAVSALLFLVFLVGLIEAAARGLELSCGCFGGGGATTSTHYTLDILRDVGLLALALFVVVWPFTYLSIEAYLARHDYVPEPSAKRMRTAEGRRKYEAAVAARRKEAASRNLYLNASLAVIVVLVSFVGIGVQANRAKISGELTATNATVANGVVVGTKAAATVDVYEDFQCPHCLAFEQQVGATLLADAKANLAQVRYHPLAFLSDYSTRAANAALCVSDVSVDAFTRYHALLFTPKVQPKEGSAGRSNTQLISYASQIKLSSNDVSSVRTCVLGKTHEALVAAITDRASKKGINSTPTIFVNGKSVSPTLAAVKKAIADADANGPAPTPSPSSSSSSPASGSISPSGSGSSASGSPTPVRTPASSSATPK